MRIGMVIAAAFVAAAIVGLFNRRASMSRWVFWAVAVDGPCKGTMLRMDAAHHYWEFADPREPGAVHRYVMDGIEFGDVTTVRMHWAGKRPVVSLPIEDKWNQE